MRRCFQSLEVLGHACFRRRLRNIVSIHADLPQQCSGSTWCYVNCITSLLTIAPAVGILALTFLPHLLCASAFSGLFAGVLFGMRLRFMSRAAMPPQGAGKEFAFEGAIKGIFCGTSVDRFRLALSRFLYVSPLFTFGLFYHPTSRAWIGPTNFVDTLGMDDSVRSHDSGWNRRDSSDSLFERGKSKFSETDNPKSL
eukprot:TRINITY_DN33120_c0_g1_i1.p1 TRINITY_DN33120_c0_g1~~TRINITY_DN33120_c0_g1_i1.p1  ORF type:complete len:197 (+),score=9.56 TRINITY_DN33120_c0_g1_i1:146-736(+)